MTVSVPSALLLPSDVQVYLRGARQPSQKKYKEVLSAGLKKSNGQRSASCTKLPPLHSPLVEKGSPGLSSTSTRASSTHSSQSKFSSWPQPEQLDNYKITLPSIKGSRRSFSSGQTSAPPLFPELPNLLTETLFCKRPRNASKEIQEIRKEDKKSGQQKHVVRPQREVSCQHRPEQTASNHKRTLVPAREKSKSTKGQRKVGHASRSFEQYLIDHKKEKASVEHHHPTQNINASTAGDCRKDSTATSQQKVVTPVDAFAAGSSAVDCHSDDNVVDIVNSRPQYVVNSNPQSPVPVNYFGDIVYVQDERCDNGRRFMTYSTSEASLPASVLSDDSDRTVVGSKPGVPELPNQQPVVLDKAAANDISTAQTSSAPAMDERHVAATVEAMLSPVRVAKRVGFQALPETTTVEAMLSPVRVAKRISRPRIARGRTIGVKGQLDTKIIPDEKLQGLKTTFSQYDEDHNGWLSVLEFGKFLEDQGMEVDISDMEDAVLMVAPEGKNGIDLDSFTQLLAHGLQAEAFREEQYCGYSTEDAAVLRGVFDAYDVNHNGFLDAAEIGILLQDMGQAPQSHSEQEALRNVLEKIVGGSLRPLRFREFLELAKILETTSIGSGGENPDKQHEHRRSSDRLEIARKVGLTMADVSKLEDIFVGDSRNGSTLSTTELYELLKSRLRLHAAEGEREQKVHFTIEKQAGSAGFLDFEDFLIIVGDLVDAKLATVSSLFGREVFQDSTTHFKNNMAALLK